MKKFSAFLYSAMILILSGINVPGTTDIPVEKKEAVIGAWVHRDFYYVFKDSVMTALKIEGEPKGYKTFRYMLERMGAHDLIIFGKDLSDSKNLDFLLVDEVTDSTAVFAAGTPFVRADSSTGLIGTWKHMKEFETILLTIKTNTVDYRETAWDVNTGLTHITEERYGLYTPGKGKDRGRFYISFDDGTRTTIFPIIYGNILYLFDLCPRKSMFQRVERAPRYSDYKKAAGK